ncbi:hypothetical protein CYLTODRAFT_444307 [Cylindrobasidium torrendii FP15055 ss-10]|uniref:Uncharacterized protein n=1 Tax=Cylindrobasidium torrendii FP15055 ss-10 TaxID=1314674 RepID=A0A0D7BA33_9AGAR|nr:hypothetical protein CYLTODRAFT_444307 [Cylindrobasidium torrendii FP15055 ss-10]
MATEPRLVHCTPVTNLTIPYTTASTSTRKTRRRSNATNETTYTLRPSNRAHTTMKFQNPSCFRVAVTGPRPAPEKPENSENDVPSIKPGGFFTEPQPPVELLVSADGDANDDSDDELSYDPELEWLPIATTSITVVDDPTPGFDVWDRPARLVGLSAIPEWEVPGSDPLDRPTARVCRSEESSVGGESDTECEDEEDPVLARVTYKRRALDELSDEDSPVSAPKYLPSLFPAEGTASDEDDEDDEHSEDRPTWEPYICGVPGHLPHAAANNCEEWEADEDQTAVAESPAPASYSRSPSPEPEGPGEAPEIAGKKRVRSDTADAVRQTDEATPRQVKKLRRMRAPQ